MGNSDTIGRIIIMQTLKKMRNVVIAKTGELVSKPVREERLKPRKSGLWKGKIFVPDNFNDEDEEINKLFYEGDSLV